MNIDELIEAEAARSQSAWFHKDDVKQILKVIFKQYNIQESKHIKSEKKPISEFMKKHN